MVQHVMVSRLAQLACVSVVFSGCSSTMNPGNSRSHSELPRGAPVAHSPHSVHQPLHPPLAPEALAPMDSEERVFVGVLLADCRVGTDVGPFVAYVSAGSPADLAGVRVGDMVVGLGTAEISSRRQFVAKLLHLAPGFVHKLTIRRGTQLIGAVLRTRTWSPTASQLRGIYGAMPPRPCEWLNEVRAKG
jgi:membrane-associated protease RseP (regulator of RpoE activity)